MVLILFTLPIFNLSKKENQMVKDTCIMSEMDSFSYMDKIKNGNKTIIIPVGAIEQHGPHMSMNVDVVLSSSVSKGVAEKIDALVAPTINYAAKSQQRSGGGYHLIGTTSLDGYTLILYVKDIIKEFVRHGFKNIILMNGHFENNSFLMEAIDLALTDVKLKGFDDIKCIFMSYWDFVTDETINKIYPDGFPGWALEHAGVMETSLMLYLAPEFVDMSRVMDIPPDNLPLYDVYPIIPERTPKSGCLSSPLNSTKEKGELLYNVCVNGIAQTMKKEIFNKE